MRISNHPTNFHPFLRGRIRISRLASPPFPLLMIINRSRFVIISRCNHESWSKIKLGEETDFQACHWETLKTSGCAQCMGPLETRRKVWWSEKQIELGPWNGGDVYLYRYFSRSGRKVSAGWGWGVYIDITSGDEQWRCSCCRTTVWLLSFSEVCCAAGNLEALWLKYLTTTDLSSFSW